MGKMVDSGIKENYEFNPKMYKTVANNIKKYRNLQKISLEELSLKTEIKKNYLEKLENNESEVKISIYDLYKISVILNTSIEKFFEED